MQCQSIRWLYALKLWNYTLKTRNQTQRAYRRKYPRQKAPEQKTIRAIYSKFTSTGNLSDVKRPTRSRRARSDTNINAVRDHVAKYPNLSIRRRATALGLSTTSLQCILENDLKLVPHKVNISGCTLYHFPHVNTHQQRMYVDIITFRELVLYNDRTLRYHNKRHSIMYCRERQTNKQTK